MRRLLPMLALAVTGRPAAGQEWSVVVLHPAGGLRSEVTALTATRQGGWYTPPAGEDQAGFWMGSAASWTLLSNPASGGWVFGMDNEQQAGTHNSAALWRGTPQSYVSLQPPAAPWATGAGAVRGNMQVGSLGSPTGNHHGVLWRGTPETFVDLHPAGAVRSDCSSTDGFFQGGFVDQVQGSRWATLWNGTAQNFVTLSTQWSQVHGMAPGIQVGEVQGGGIRAALWRGTAQSYENLNPPGAATRLYATTGKIHVGQGVLTPTGLAGALINFGTVDSWHDLHQYLPPQYSAFSAAKAVYQDGGTIYVGGYATLGDPQAILWIGTVPCYANCDMSTSSPRLTANDFICFINDYITGNAAANCDQSTTAPTLTANDFVCFINAFAAGCS